MAFKIGVLYILSIAATASACICPRLFVPVCGSDGETYGTPCDFRCAASKSDTNLTIVKPVTCDESLPELEACACSFDCEMDPYECLLLCDSSKLSSLKKPTSSCKAPEKKDCMCPSFFSPRCGSDGNTYSNLCLLQCAQELHPKLSDKHKGACTK